MQVSVEVTSKIERRVTVVVPVEKVDEAYDKRIVKLGKTANIKGFRPGKVPLDYIKKRFGETARQEALSEVIQSSLYAAIHQEKLNPVGVPAVEPKMVAPGHPLEFIATFEVLPEINHVKFEANKIEKLISTITDADIDKVIEHLRQQHVTWRKVDRAAELKDQVVIDFRGSMNGKPFENGEAHDYPIILGSKMMIPGFEDGLLGAKTGEERTLSLTFPENYFAKEFSGKAAEFNTKIIKISESIYPEIDASFVKKLGVKSGNIEDLREEVKKNLERELNRLTKAKLQTQVFNILLEQNSLDVPKSMIEREADRIHKQVHPHHHNHEHNHTEEEMQGFTTAAHKNVTLGLLVGELIKQHNLTVDKERVQQFIGNYAAAYENPKEVTSWYTNDKRKMAEVEMQVLEDQLVEKMLENIQIIERMVSYDEFAKSVKQATL